MKLIISMLALLLASCSVVPEKNNLVTTSTTPNINPLLKKGEKFYFLTYSDSETKPQSFKKTIFYLNGKEQGVAKAGLEKALGKIQDNSVVLIGPYFDLLNEIGDSGIGQGEPGEIWYYFTEWFEKQSNVRVWIFDGFAFPPKCLAISNKKINANKLPKNYLSWSFRGEKRIYYLNGKRIPDNCSVTEYIQKRVPQWSTILVTDWIFSPVSKIVGTRCPKLHAILFKLSLDYFLLYTDDSPIVNSEK